MPARRRPSRASPSVSGVAWTETNGSRHWVSASRPLAAVTGGGHETVRSGSTSATRGIMSGLRRLALTLVGRDGEHRVGGHLGPRARGGGHRDAGRGGPGNGPAGSDHLQVIQRITAVAEQDGHGLAGIDDAAAADRGNHVGAVLARGGDGGPGQFDRRLAGHREHRGGHAHIGEQFRVPLGVGARAHQRAGAEPGQDARQVGRPAGPGHDPAGGGELEPHRHGEPLAQPVGATGNTVE